MALVTTSTLALTLAACGGGDSGNGGGNAGSANTAPAFSSTASASVVENVTGVVYQAAATDAQGDTVTYAISGGADASSFTITSGGALSFTTSPNYDLPTDANDDNVYVVTIQASDGRASSTRSVSITVTNDREGIAVERVATSLTDPVALVSLDSFDNLAVALKDGSIYRVQGSSGQRSLMFNVQTAPGSTRPTLSLLGMTVAKAGNSTALYIVSAQGGQASVVCIGCWSSPSYGALAEISDGTAIAIGTGPDGAAYVAIGDPGGDQAQNVNSGDRHGKLYRYSPHPDPYGGASIPQDLFLKELVGVGLRAPSGITSLPGGRLAISDRGATNFDELSLTTSLRNLNFGWPFFQGTREVRAGGAGLTGLVTPSLVVPIGTEKRQSRGFVGGTAYTAAVRGIANHYVFADKDGRIWSIPLSALAAGGTLQSSALELRDDDFKPDIGAIDHPVAITADRDTGALYILDADGELFRVTPPGGSVIVSPTNPK